MRGVWRCAPGCGKDVAKTWYYSCTCYMYSYRDVFPLALHVLNGFVNNLTGRQCEVAGDATQEQSTNGMNQTDRIRHHFDVGGTV